MSSKRHRFSGEQKAKIALEGLRGDRTLQEIASKHQVQAVSGFAFDAPSATHLDVLLEAHFLYAVDDFGVLLGAPYGCRARPPRQGGRPIRTAVETEPPLEFEVRISFPGPIRRGVANPES